MVKKKVESTQTWNEESLTQHIATLKERLQAKFKVRDTRNAEVYSHRMMTNKITIPDAYKVNVPIPYRSDLIHDYLRRVQAIFGHETPTARVEPSRPGEKAQALSSHIEDWWMALCRKLSKQNNILPLLYDSIPATGGAVWKILLKTDSWLDVPERGENEEAETYNKKVREHRQGIFPFVWDHVPTNTFYPYEVNGILKETLEITKRETFDLARKYDLTVTIDGKVKKVGDRVGDSSGMQSSSLPETCEFMEWFDDEYYAYLIDGEIVRWDKHHYGQPPYLYATSNANASRFAEDQWLSFAYPLVSIQDGLETLGNEWLNWAHLTAWPIPQQIPLNPEFIPKYPKDYVLILEAGKGANPLPGHEIRFLSPPSSGADLHAFWEILSRQASNLALAPILQGMSPGAGTAGITTAMMLTVAKSMFEPAAASFARAWDKMGEFVLRLIDQVLIDPVAIWYDGKEWLELGADDIKGYYEIYHTLQPVIPAETRMKYDMAADAVARNLGTKKAAIEAQGYHNPEKILMDVMLEKFMDMPQILNLVLEKAYERLNLVETAPQPQGTPAGIPAGVSGMAIPMGTPAVPTGVPVETAPGGGI